MLISSLCDYSDACILVARDITITGSGADDATKQSDKRNKGVVFKNCTPFTDYISEINNAQNGNANNLNVVVLMYNLIE